MMTATKAARAILALKAGTPGTELARAYGVKPATFYGYMSRFKKARKGK